jgi:hypothetical protein
VTVVFKRFGLTFTVMALATFSGCNPGGPPPKTVSLADPRIAPMLRAMESVDRTSMGFTPISTNADVTLEGQSSNYDAMLHIYAATHRTVAFRKIADGYRWISEQEIHYGPRTCRDVDGPFQEHIVIEYQLEPVNGIPTNLLSISYLGCDARFAKRNALTLEDIKPVLAEWKGTPVR